MVTPTSMSNEALIYLILAEVAVHWRAMFWITFIRYISRVRNGNVELSAGIFFFFFCVAVFGPETFCTPNSNYFLLVILKNRNQLFLEQYKKKKARNSQKKKFVSHCSYSKQE
ncbi:UNVERIFIED_CONTAM: hypothetical protein NCL1_21594 [Trichonephila clavipes]